jgi:hypothetical protein
MRYIRWTLGFAIVTTCYLLCVVFHRLIHVGAWLMDRESWMEGCVTCKG